MARLEAVNFDPFKASPLDHALSAEGVTGPLAEVAKSIYMQESGGGKNTKTSNAGAVGGMQIIPSTFASVADKDWDINDPIQNARAGVRYIKQLNDLAGGDPRLIAAGYYGGPGGLQKARNGQAVSDPRNPRAPNTLQYADQVASRLPNKGVMERVAEAVIPAANAAQIDDFSGLEPVDFDPFARPEKKQTDLGDRFKRSAVRAASAVLGPGAQIADELTGGRSLPDMAAGLVRGAGSVGATLARPFESAEDNAARRRDMDSALQSLGADPSSLAYAGGKLGAEIAGTAGVGSALAIPARAAGATGLANALSSGGMTLGAAAPQSAVRNMLLRSAGGAATGAGAAGLVNPTDAGTGALIGGAAPGVIGGLGKAGALAGAAFRGPSVPQGIREAAIEGRRSGYVIPPTQVNPSITNRLLEGAAGKLTTAQNASARNQDVTNRLAREAIGAEDLTPEGIAAVRANANAAYEALGRSSPFIVDPEFHTTLKNASGSTRQMAKDFPELINNEVQDLVSSLMSRESFSAQSTIEAIKLMRFNGSANRANIDPAKKALGRVQMKIANALEDLVDRNLEKAGNQQMLAEYRDARQTLAKVADVEKAINTTTGNVDGSKLAAALKKGRPLTGPLRDAAEFAQAFPKAVQTPERMGSLPQLSPLDFAVGTIGGASAGIPGFVGILARPAARAAALSAPVQNRLLTSGGPSVIDDEVRNLLLSSAYRSSPVLVSDR